MIYAQHLRLYLCQIIIIYDYTCARLSTFVAKLLTTSMKVPAPMTVLVYTNLKTPMTIPVLYTQCEYITCTLLTVPVPGYQHTWMYLNIHGCTLTDMTVHVPALY